MIVTLAEAQAHLGASTADETYLNTLITQIGAAVEKYTGRSFTLAVRTSIVDGGGNALVLPFAPSAIISPATTSVTSILDRFASNAAVSLTNIDVDDDAGLVYNLGGGKWSEGKRRYTVVYGGGYNGAPDDVKLAALTWIAEVFENNQGAKTESLGDHNVMWAGVINAVGMPDRVKAILDTCQRILY